MSVSVIDNVMESMSVPKFKDVKLEKYVLKSREFERSLISDQLLILADILLSATMTCKRRCTIYTSSEVEWISSKHSYNYCGDAKGGKINQQVINQGRENKPTSN